MKILEFLGEKNIFFNFEAAGKKDFFKKAVALVMKEHCEFCQEDVLALFLEREKTMTTGIGKKIAIPHIIYEKCKAQELYVFSLKEPIDFKSLDKQPVKLVIMFLGPHTETNLAYLQVLAKLSRLIKKDAMVEKLLNADSAQDIFNTFKEHDGR